MGIQQIKNNFIEVRNLLDKFIADENNWDAIKKAGDEIVRAVKSNKKVISCGNGGSMSDAMHFAEEFVGRFREDRNPLPAIAISDPTYISCTANDYGYEYIFSRYIEGIGQKGDVLLSISCSGNSENIIKAVEKAKEKGMYVIGLTGRDGGKLGKMCDTEIRVPYSNYTDRIQEIHIKIIHSLIHYVELKLKL